MAKREAGKEDMMNRAEADVHKAGGDKRERPHSAGVGDERKADMRGALEGDPTDMNPLRHAIHELHEQHPHAYHEHGPHHGTSDHVRHEPLHGMRPSK